MKSKVEFYKAFFEELEKKGFGVDKPCLLYTSGAADELEV